MQVGSGGHVVYTGVALPALADAAGKVVVVDPVEVTTGRISGQINIATALLTVGGIETIAGPTPNNSPVLPIVRHDQVGHGATVTINVNDNGQASAGAIQTNIGAIGNFETINGAYRNVISFNNPYYQLTNSSATGASTDLSNPANLNPYIYYTIDYAIDNNGNVTRTITAHDVLPGTGTTLYNAAGQLNTGLIGYYNTTATIVSPNGQKTASLDGLLRSFVGTLVDANTGTTTATNSAAGAGAAAAPANYSVGSGDAPVIVTSYKTDANGNPIILLPMDNAVNQGTSNNPNFNQAMITAGTDFATNYRAYMPVTGQTAASTVYGATGGNSVGVQGAQSDTSANGALSRSDDDQQLRPDRRRLADANSNIIYGVQLYGNKLTAMSLVAPRNAVQGATDPTQMFVANPDAYNYTNSYADGLLTPRINSYASGSPDININAGVVSVQQSLIGVNMAGSIVDQTQFAIIGNGNFVSTTALSLVQPVATSTYIYNNQGVAASGVLASNEDLANGINTSSRGDIVVNEGFISGNIDIVAAGLVTVTSLVTAGKSTPMSNAYMVSRIGDGSAFLAATAGFGLASGADDATGALHPSRGADLTINSADMLGASVKITDIVATAVAASAIQGDKSTVSGNTVSASIGAGVDALVASGYGGAGQTNSFFASQPLGDAATASARAGDVTFNRGSIWDGMILVDSSQSLNLATGTGTAGGVVVGGALATTANGGAPSPTNQPTIFWTPGDDVYYTLVNGVYTVQSRASGELPSGFGGTPTIYNSDIDVASLVSVIVTANATQANNGPVLSNASYARIGQGDLVNVATGNGGASSVLDPSSMGAASGGRGGDVTVTQRIASDSNRNLDGDFINNGTNGSVFHDVANGERGNVTVSAPIITMISSVTTGDQGTASYNTLDATIGNGDDYVLVTGNGGNAGAGNQSGVNIFDPAQGGAGGNVNVLLGAAETQGNIVVNGGPDGNGGTLGATLLVSSTVIEGQQTLTNFNQVEIEPRAHIPRLGHRRLRRQWLGRRDPAAGLVRQWHDGFVLRQRARRQWRLHLCGIARHRQPHRQRQPANAARPEQRQSAVLRPPRHVGHRRQRPARHGDRRQGIGRQHFVAGDRHIRQYLRGIGSRDRVTEVAGVGGNGGIAPTGFNYGFQSDASGGDGGDATSVSGLVRSTININSAGAVLVQSSLPKDAGGFLQVDAQIGQNQDIYTSSAAAGNGGNLIASGTIGTTTINGNGGIQDLNLSSATGLEFDVIIKRHGQDHTD